MTIFSYYPYQCFLNFPKYSETKVRQLRFSRRTYILYKYFLGPQNKILLTRSKKFSGPKFRLRGMKSFSGCRQTKSKIAVMSSLNQR